MITKAEWEKIMQASIDETMDKVHLSLWLKRVAPEDFIKWLNKVLQARTSTIIEKLEGLKVLIEPNFHQLFKTKAERLKHLTELTIYNAALDLAIKVVKEI